MNCHRAGDCCSKPHKASRSDRNCGKSGECTERNMGKIFEELTALKRETSERLETSDGHWDECKMDAVRST